MGKVPHPTGELLLYLSPHTLFVVCYRFKVWHFSGGVVTQKDTPPKQELWEVSGEHEGVGWVGEG